MLTKSQLLQFARELDDELVLSVYAEGGVDDPARRTEWRRRLDLAIDHARSLVSDAPHGERETFERCIRLLDETLRTESERASVRGWVGFITSSGVRHAEPLSVDVPTLVVWRTGAIIAPYVRALKQQTPALIVVADRKTARIYQYQYGDLADVESHEAALKVGAVYHMSTPPRRGYHTGTRGSVGKDALQREQHTARDRMVRQAADRLADLAEADSWILAGGIPEVANAIVTALPDPVRERARLIDLDVHASEAAIRLTAEREITAASRARTAAVIDDLAERRAADGRGVLELPQTLQMLREKSVERLIVTDGLVREHPDDAEAAIRMALEQGADIELVSGEGADRLDREAHGIAAALRFVPYSSPASGQPS